MVRWICSNRRPATRSGKPGWWSAFGASAHYSPQCLEPGLLPEHRHVRSGRAQPRRQHSALPGVLRVQARAFSLATKHDHSQAGKGAGAWVRAADRGRVRLRPALNTKGARVFGGSASFPPAWCVPISYRSALCLESMAYAGFGLRFSPPYCRSVSVRAAILRRARLSGAPPGGLSCLSSTRPAEGTGALSQ